MRERARESASERERTRENERERERTREAGKLPLYCIGGCEASSHLYCTSPTGWPGSLPALHLYRRDGASLRLDPYRLDPYRLDPYRLDPYRLDPCIGGCEASSHLYCTSPTGWPGSLPALHLYRRDGASLRLDPFRLGPYRLDPCIGGCETSSYLYCTSPTGWPGSLPALHLYRRDGASLRLGPFRLDPASSPTQPRISPPRPLFNAQPVSSPGPLRPRSTQSASQCVC